MSRWKTYLPHLVILIFLFGCEGNRGPTGPPGEGYDELTDASVKPSVIFTYPSDGSTGPYDFYNEFQVRFNKIMDLPSLRRAMTFSSAAGNISADTLYMTSENGDLILVSARESVATSSGFLWRIGESYSLTVSTEAMDVNGNHLAQPFMMTFNPEPYFRVRTVTPKDRSVNNKTNVKPRLIFNSVIDTSIISQIFLTPPVEGVWVLSNSRTVIFRPTTRLTRFDIGTEYTLSLSAIAHDQYGNRVAAPYTSRFSTIPFRVSSTSPKNESIASSRSAWITFTLTAPVDTGTVRNAISISPSVTGSLAFYTGSPYISFTPNGLLDSLTQYTFTVSTSLKSASGKNLALPFVLKFTTSE